MLDGFDPSTIQDPALRQVVQALMNQLEELAAKVRAQADEIGRLRDENRRLKGEQGKPDIKPNKPPRQLSSEAERAVPKPRCKRAKRADLRIDRELVVPLDPSTLPPDAQFKETISNRGQGCTTRFRYNLRVVLVSPPSL